jgi:predicted HicB family RNase H-like nuclease
MKRIIDGVTYNTDTSTELASLKYKAEYRHESYPCDGVLYQTRGGAFFVVLKIDLGRDELGKAKSTIRFEAMSDKAAHDWIKAEDTKIFNNPFDKPPKAMAERDPSATAYTRLPVSLKQRIDEAAQAENLSTNSYVIRCLETGLRLNENVRKDIGLLWYLARTIEDNNEGFPMSSLQKMAGTIAEIVKDNWDALGFKEDGFDEDTTRLMISNEYWDEISDYVRQL